MSTATALNTGRVTQVIGSTFDVEFAPDELPPIYNAILVEKEIKGIQIKVTGEVQQHLGGGRVRCVALGSTDGWQLLAFLESPHPALDGQSPRTALEQGTPAQRVIDLATAEGH